MSGLKVDTRFINLSAYYTALQTDALIAAVVGGSSLTNYYTKTQTDSLLAGKEASITAGTASQYWRGDKTWQTLSTSVVTEGSNLYYTDARARASVSESITGIDYDNSTGVFSLTSGYVIPTTTQETNWNTAYTNRITNLTVTGSSGAATLISNVLNIPTYTLAGLGGISLSSLSAISPIFYNNSTGVISSQAATTSVNGYLTSTDWTIFNNKQAALSGTGFVKISGTTISYDNSTYLTDNQTITLSGDVTGSGATSISTTVTKINGTSLAGLATGLLKNTTSTGVPSIAVVGTDYIAGGVGTANYVAKFSGSGILTNSILQDNGTKVSIAGATNIESFNNTGATKLSGLNIASDNIIISSIAGLELQYSSGVGLITAYNRTGGVYLPLNFRATDLTITSNGTASHRFFSGGNFSVGSVIDSGYKLDVNGTGRFVGTDNSPTTNITSFYANNLTAGIGISYNIIRALSSNSNAAMSLLGKGTGNVIITGVEGNTGNVLIGTPTDAGYKLDVNGTGRFTGNLSLTGSTPRLWVNSSATYGIGYNNSTKLQVVLDGTASVIFKNIASIAAQIVATQHSSNTIAASYPAYTFGGDESTGIGRWGAGDVFISTNGVSRVNVTDNSLIVNTTTASTSTTTGALTVAGGVGIAGSLNIGSTIKTIQPSANGAGAWKLGKLIGADGTGAASFLEFDVDGVLYIIPAKIK